MRQNGVFVQHSPALFSVLLMTVSSEAGSQSEMIVGRNGFCWLPKLPWVLDLLFKVCVERGLTAFSWRQRLKLVTKKTCFSFLRLLLPGCLFQTSFSHLESGYIFQLLLLQPVRSLGFYEASMTLNVTLGPNRIPRLVKFPREKAGRRAVVHQRGQVQDMLFDPSAEQWISVFPGDTGQYLEMNFGCHKFWFS